MISEEDFVKLDAKCANAESATKSARAVRGDFFESVWNILPKCRETIRMLGEENARLKKSSDAIEGGYKMLHVENAQHEKNCDRMQTELIAMTKERDELRARLEPKFDAIPEKYRGFWRDKDYPEYSVRQLSPDGLRVLAYNGCWFEDYHSVAKFKGWVDSGEHIQVPDPSK